MVSEIHGLIAAEANVLGGDVRRVALGGNSQGGTVALHAAMTYPGGAVGALVCGCTILMDQTPIDETKAALPIFVFVAEKDEEYPPKFQQQCYQRLSDAGFLLISHVEAGLSHYANSTAELHHTAAWLASALHEKVVEVTFRDVPGAPAASAPSLFEL